VNDSTKPFVRESLALAGIGPEKTFSMAGTGLVECERLIVPALPGPTGFPHPMGVAWLRSFFKPFIAKSQGEKLCIERPAPGRRRWVPSPNLKGQLGRAGFQLISLEHLNLKDQVALISAAPEILAPHGAALAWLALAPAGCRVIELVPAGYPNPCFFRLSRICGLHHTILFPPCETEVPAWDLDPDAFELSDDNSILSFLEHVVKKKKIIFK
jgi:capsular polysaccharide biosynthesis protein